MYKRQEQNSSRPEIVSESSLSSSLDCATTLFAQPNVRFMHKLHSNNEDATFTVSDLPTGLSYNEGRCLIEGTVETADTYTYNVTVSIPGQEDLTVPCTLTVTTDLQQPVPFMGWLSWNSIEGNISESIIRPWPTT